MRIAIIGCGVMGAAFARHFAKCHQVFLSDKTYEKADSLAKDVGGKACEKASEAVVQAEIVLLAIKPKDLKSVSQEISSSLKKEHLVMSILAGTPLLLLRKYFSQSALLRITPNLALIYGEGVLGLVDDVHITENHKQLIENLLDDMGLLVWLDENKVDALNALAASGIGFFFFLMEAFIEGGVAIGLSAQESREYTLKTMEGAAAMLRHTGNHPAELKLQIASPAGTTIAGIKKMEEYGVRAGIINALVAAHEKGLHMFKDKNLSE